MPLNIKKKMPKISGHGQASILSEHEIIRIRKALEIPWRKLFWDVARFTGERWGAITALQVSDVYRDAATRAPHEYITFRARTRKADPCGIKHTRQVPVHPSLYEILKAYQPPSIGWLFPSKHTLGDHITYETTYLMLREALERCGLDRKGISTHSTRRTFITNLHNKGIDLYTLRQITGHKDLEALSRYIESDPERIKHAIACL